MTCPKCGAEAAGNYCAACGSALGDATCTECGAPLLPGARFCNHCGRAVARTGSAPRAAARTNLPWYLLAAALLVIVVLLAFPQLRGGAQPQMASTVSPARMGAGVGTPPPLTGTPREQADRLFNRIMTAQEQGDTANARFFAPMAIQAYRMAEPLDADGLYHLALIHNVATDYAAARSIAERILAADSNHLLGLAAAAEATQRAGDRAVERAYYRRFIEAYDAERARGLGEYRDHDAVLQQQLATARREVGG